MSKKKSSAKQQKSEQKQQGIVVTVDDDHVADIHKVAGKLRSRGMKVDEVLEAIGVISGSVAGPVTELRSIPGVAAVEEQPHFQLPPPDAPVK